MTASVDAALGRADTTPRRIAGFLGPIVIVLALSETKNLAIWVAGDPPLTYQAGLLWSIGGLTAPRSPASRLSGLSRPAARGTIRTCVLVGLLRLSCSAGAVRR